MLKSWAQAACLWKDCKEFPGEFRRKSQGTLQAGMAWSGFQDSEGRGAVVDGGNA